MAQKHPDWFATSHELQLAMRRSVGDGTPLDAAVRKGFTLEKLEEMAEPRRLRFVISTGDVDRDNDTIDPNGWDLTNFKANPVVLFAHSHRDLPVGKAVEIGIEAGKLVAVAEFATHPFAETVLQLLKGGFMRATSVGFRALEYAINEERRGIDFKRQELLEFSVVPVPANAHALIAASAAGVELEPLRKWMADLLAEWPGELKLPGKAWEKVLGAAAKHAAEREPSDTTTLGKIDIDHDAVMTKLAAMQVELDAVLAKFERVNQLTADANHQAVEQDADDAAEVKRGRVLSAANERRLRKAHGCSADCQGAINEVLAALDEQQEESAAAADDDMSLAVLDVADEHRQADAETFVLELADELDGFEIDADALRDGLREAVTTTLGAIVRESTERELNRIRGRVD